MLETAGANIYGWVTIQWRHHGKIAQLKALKWVFNSKTHCITNRYGAQMTVCPYITVKQNWADFLCNVYNAALGEREWYSLFMGVLSLATSGHLPPAPLNQTNAKLEMPELDNTNYKLQLQHSLPGMLEAALRCLLWGGIKRVWVAAFSFQVPFYRRPLCFIHNYSVSTACEQRLEAVQPLLRWHNVSNARIWGEFVSV